MIHTIRRDGQLEQIDCEIGSGIFDKNRREIVEGDRVRCYYANGNVAADTTVIIDNGKFWLMTDEQVTSPLDDSDQPYCEVIGHVED